MKTLPNLISNRKSNEKADVPLISGTAPMPQTDKKLIEAMDFFASAEEARMTSNDSQALLYPMEFYKSAQDAKEAVEQYGLFVKCDVESISNIKKSDNITNRTTLIMESPDRISEKSLSKPTEDTVQSNRLSMSKPIQHKPTSYELSQRILNAFPIIVCEDRLYVRQTIFYQMKSYADMQRLVKSWLVQNNIPDVKTTLINEIISMIFMEESLVKKASELNKNVIAFRNGLLNIEDGQFYPHSPQILITYLIECDYIPNQAYCPCFNDFLNYITGNDIALQTRIWQTLGYILSPDTRGKAIFLLQGAPNSGKSVLAELIKSFFSDEAVMPLEAHNIGMRFSASNLIGKALCLSGDMNAEPLSSSATSKLKQFSGNDFMSSDVKHSAMIAFYGRAKFVLVTNHPLLTEERDDAFVERIVTIPFDYVKPSECRDRNLIEKLHAERNAIATIAIQYYFDLVRNNYRFEGNYTLNSSQSILKKTDENENVSSNIFKYVKNFFEKSENNGVFVDDAYRLYIKEIGYIDKKHFSTHFCEMSNRIFDGVKERRRRLPKENPISYVSGIRFIGG